MPSLRNFAAIALGLALGLPLAAAGQDAPGVFKVPGTDSTIKFYGYVQLDTTLDLGGRIGDIEDNDWATILPLIPADDSVKKKGPQLYMTARTSRFGIQTNTPSKWGNVGVRLEGDFNGPNAFQGEFYTNSVLFRLRHGYGQIGGLLIGQTWTTFLDFGGAPETVDFNGPGTLALVRNPMIRYTFNFAPGMTLALAAENAAGARRGGTKFQTVPDFHVNFTYGAKWGHVSARGVTQYFREYIPATATLGATTADKFSAAGALSASVKAGPATIVGQVAGGPGIGRYLLNSLGAAAVAGDIGSYSVVGPANDRSLELWNVLGVHAGANIVATPEWRFNLVGAYTVISDPKIAGPQFNQAAGNDVKKDMIQIFANAFWSFSKTAELGLEYGFGQWKSFSTATSPELKGTQNRITATVHYNFF